MEGTGGCLKSTIYLSPVRTKDPEGRARQGLGPRGLMPKLVNQIGSNNHEAWVWLWKSLEVMTGALKVQLGPKGPQLAPQGDKAWRVRTSA